MDAQDVMDQYQIMDQCRTQWFPGGPGKAIIERGEKRITVVGRVISRQLQNEPDAGLSKAILDLLDRKVVRNAERRLLNVTAPCGVYPENGILEGAKERLALFGRVICLQLKNEPADPLSTAIVDLLDRMLDRREERQLFPQISEFLGASPRMLKLLGELLQK